MSNVGLFYWQVRREVRRGEVCHGYALRKQCQNAVIFAIAVAKPLLVWASETGPKVFDMNREPA
jgi:hypothetical protein